MTNFYQVSRKLNVPEGAPFEAIGLLVVESVMANRVEQNRIWRTGDAKDYRMKEMNRVLHALEALSHTAVRVPTSLDLAKNDDYTRRLAPSAHREIEQICFLYDVVKFIHFHTEGENADRFTNVARFIGQRLPGAALRKPEWMLQYQRDNESPREEYHRILANMRNGLVDNYGVILEKLD